MNYKLLVGFLAVLAVVASLPLVARLTPPASPPAPAETAPSPEAVSAPPTMPADEAPAPPPSRPGLNAEPLGGTAWEVGTEYGPVQVQLLPGGQVSASHALAGQLNGTWRVNGNQLITQVSVEGKMETMRATIQGDTLVAEGQQIRRLR